MVKPIHTDSRGRMTLSGHPDETFIQQDNADGSVLLSPALTISKAQYLYDSNPELQAILTQAAESGVVRGPRRPRSERQ